MSHIGDLLVLLGIVLATVPSFALGWWLRGRRRRWVA